LNGEFTDEDRRRNQFITGCDVTPETETTNHWDRQHEVDPELWAGSLPQGEITFH
jgi:hypothetical protein